MDLTIFPTRLHGTITPPPSKSQAHRLIILAALAKGKNTIENFEPSEDLLATVVFVNFICQIVRFFAYGHNSRQSGLDEHRYHAHIQKSDRFFLQNHPR